MTEQSGGSALRAVPGGLAAGGNGNGKGPAASAGEGASGGLTAPERRARLALHLRRDGGAGLPRRASAWTRRSSRRKAGGRSAEQVLLEAGAITGDQLARATAQRFGLYHVDLTSSSPTSRRCNLISAQAAGALNAVPIGFDERGHAARGDVRSVERARPGRPEADDRSRGAPGGGLARGHPRPDRPHEPPRQRRGGGRRRRSEEELADVTEIRESAEDAPVIKLVNSIIAQAVEEGASDIHFEPDGRDMRVRFRVDGVLRETTTIPRRMVAGVVSRVKIMADLDIAEKRVPQDGRVSLTVEGHAIDIARGDHAVACTARGSSCASSTRSQALIGLDALGMSETSAERFENAFRRSLRRRARDRPDRLGQVHDALRRAQRDQRARAQHHHDRGPGRVPAPRHQPAAGEPEGRPELRRRAALDAARGPRRDHGRRDPRRARRPGSPSSRRSPATSCSARCTPTTPRRRSPG